MTPASPHTLLSHSPPPVQRCLPLGDSPLTMTGMDTLTQLRAHLPSRLRTPLSPTPMRFSYPGPPGGKVLYTFERLISLGLPLSSPVKSRGIPRSPRGGPLFLQDGGLSVDPELLFIEAAANATPQEVVTRFRPSAPLQGGDKPTVKEPKSSGEQS